MAEVLRQMREHAARRDAYTVADVLESLPNVSRVVGLPERNDRFVEIVKGKKDEFWLQLEQDITAVLILVPLDTLRSCYATSLMNEPEVGGVFYEVHGAALLVRAGATALDLHVPRAPGEERNFDIRAWFGTVAINSDSKVRSDNFLFRQADDSSPVPGVPTFSATSETIDRHDAETLGIAGLRKPPIKGVRHRDTPESTSVRQILAATLAKQLPPSGINVVLLGQVGGDETSIEDALLGQDRPTFRQEQGIGKWRRVGGHISTGAFCDGEIGDGYTALSAVIRIWLQPPSETKCTLYLNSRAASPIPQHVVDQLRKEMGDPEPDTIQECPCANLRSRR